MMLQVCVNNTETPQFGGVQVSSKMGFYNTYGYIPGQVVGRVPVYFLLLLGTTMTFVVFGVVCIINWGSLLLLQGIVELICIALIPALQVSSPGFSFGVWLKPSHG